MLEAEVVPSAPSWVYRALMEFRLLGPLEVSARDGLVGLGGDKQRTVLALLLLQANRLVTADRLIDQVWDGDPPTSARNVLQTYVSRLRKSLGPERLVTRQGGYLLHADREEVDAECFATLVQEARAVSPIDPEAAVRLYRRADELWRGPALADLDEQPALRGEISHLDELRAAATEERIVVELALAHQADLVAELEALTAANPLREGLWAHLMTALYRSGRQADALAAYRRAREVLAHELALDPSAELQRLERRVLAQDPSLEVAGVPVRGLRLLERIGQGSFGVVHRAAQPQVGRDVAVKVVHPHFANDPEFIRLFEAEAQIVARLEHPHIVPLYDYWRDPTGTFLVMRLLRGGSLRDLLAHGPIATGTALAVVEQVGAALATAHRHGVVHRDVKPANILFDEDRNAYLSDFGIAMDVTVVREVKTSVEPDSSSYYLSPEEIRGEPPTARADIYSLGLVLFEMLGGRSPWVDGRGARPPTGREHELPALSTLRTDTSPDLDDVVRRATRDDPADRYPDVPAFVSAVAAALTASPPRPAIDVPARNPYKGLRPFLEPDAADFFGREDLVRRLVARLTDDAGPRLLALVGASGSGKSSVVHAGLVPALRAGAGTGSPHWLVTTMTPGSDPFAELVKALLVIAAAHPPRGMIEAIKHHGAALVDVVEWLLADQTSCLLLVVDQLEEVFVLAPEAERARFLAVLGEAAADARGRLRVVLTLRADFFDRPLAHPALAEHLGSGTELVTALRPDELESAITRPAGRVGIDLDPRLVAQLVSDVRDQPGALPLLQFALAELVDRCGSTTLTPQAYEELGGVAGAVARGAEEIYGSLSPTQQDQARQIFLRMVHRVDAAGPTRRRALRSELVSLADDVAAMESVIDTFVQRRMLSLDRDADTRETTVELAHESLLRAWTRLGRWIEDAQDDLGVRRQLARAAAEWRHARHDPAFLLVGSRLDLVRSWRSRTDLAVTPAEDEFLQASVLQRDDETAQEAARQARERNLERRALRRFQHLVAALVLGILVAGGLTLIAFDQRGQADRERSLAVVRELAAAAVANLDVDPERSVLLALEAVEESSLRGGTVEPEAVEALHRAVGASRIVLRVPGLGGALDWSPAGDLFATEGPEESGLVDIRDATTGERVRSFRGHDADINIVAFSPDGSRLGTSADDGVVRVWDTATGERLHSFEESRGQTWGVTFSPDGSLLAATSWADDRVRVWDLTTGKLVQEAGPYLSSFTTSFSPDGRRLAVATFDSESVVVDVRTGDEALVLQRPEDGVVDVDWSPDGRWIATSGLDGTVTIHDARTGRPESVLSGHRGEVVAADWSPDSGRLATGSADGTVKVWEVSGIGGRELLTIPVQERGGGLWVAFSPDGRHVMAGDQGITAVKVFDVSEGGDAEWGNLLTGAGAAVGFTPDGGRLVTSTGDGSATVWDPETGRAARTLGTPGREAPGWFALSVSSRGDVASTVPAGVAVWSLDRATAGRDVASPGPPVDLAWSPDGSLLALAEPDGRLEIVDRAGRPIAELDQDPGFRLTSARFSPDGSLVAAARIPSDRPVPGSDVVTLWDWRTRQVVREIRAGGTVAFSQEGTLLATAPEFGPVSLWNLEDGGEAVRLVGHTGGVTDVEFSPSGTGVATASADGTVRLWDATTGVERLVLRGHRGAVHDIAFSPDGAKLASASTDGEVRIWALDLQDLVTLAERSLTRALTRAECVRYASACD